MKLTTPFTSRNPLATPRAARWLAFVLLIVASAASARAQMDMFLKFTPPTSGGGPAVAGDSTDVRYPGAEGWFAIKGFSLGVTNGTTIGSANGGAGAGRAGFLDVALAKDVNSASPALFQAMTSGRQYDTAQLVVRKPGAQGGLAYLSYEFKLIFLTAQTWAGGGEVPDENVRFLHGSFRLTYRPQAPDGSLGTPVVVTWDQVRNREGF